MQQGPYTQTNLLSRINVRITDPLPRPDQKGGLQ
jgi:hypothetical protein